MRTRPRPMPPTSEPGCSTQYRTLGRCSTRWTGRPRTRCSSSPHGPSAPSDGRPMSCGDLRLRPPSAPIRYFARIVVLAAGDAVAHGDGDAVVVLHVARGTRCRSGSGAARGGVPDQDRLQQRLRDVAVLRRAGERVVGLARGVRAPGAQRADLLAGQARAERRSRPSARAARPSPMTSSSMPGVAQDLHRALVGDVRPRRVRRPAVLGDARCCRRRSVLRKSAAAPPAGRCRR